MFSDVDPVEEYLGVMCEWMSPEQLVLYIKTYHAAFGVDLKVEGVKERSVFRGLQRQYGKQAAGKIVKWAFYHHKGYWKDQLIGFFNFTKSMKWWTDIMYVEMQRAEARQRESQRPEVLSIGARKLTDL